MFLFVVLFWQFLYELYMPSENKLSGEREGKKLKYSIEHHHRLQSPDNSFVSQKVDADLTDMIPHCEILHWRKSYINSPQNGEG